MADTEGEYVYAVANFVWFAAMALLLREKKKKAKKRSVWTRPWLKRRTEGEGRGVLSLWQNELEPTCYANFIRMDPNVFSRLLALVENKIGRKDTNMRECIPASKRLGVTLRFLATGETFRSLSFATRIAHNTLSTLIPEVLRAILECLQSIYLKVPQTQDEWMHVSAAFEEQWNFPHCIGSMDGKHITFRPPRSAGSFYRNYKGTNSIVLLALVDANYKYIYIDVGRNGRVSDGGVFKRCTLSNALQMGTLNLPRPKPLPQRTNPTPYVIVADDAFPLSPNIMKPYRYRGLTNEQTIFNYRVSRARRVVENAFGQMSNKFRILLNPINLSADKVELITIACCVLHNFLKTHTTDGHSLVEDLECPLPPLMQQAGNRTSQQALDIRKEFQEYFNNEGSVPWQQQSVDHRNF